MVVILRNPDDKKKIKSFLDKGGVPSQFIRAFNLRIPNLTIVGNVLKQMNAKLRHDLYRLSLPNCKDTMIVGINIIMDDNNQFYDGGSQLQLIGCCATSDKKLTQCYTKLYKQKKPEINREERLFL